MISKAGVFCSVSKTVTNCPDESSQIGYVSCGKWESKMISGRRIFWIYQLGANTVEFSLNFRSVFDLKQINYAKNLCSFPFVNAAFASFKRLHVMNNTVVSFLIDELNKKFTIKNLCLTLLYLISSLIILLEVILISSDETFHADLQSWS